MTRLDTDTHKHVVTSIIISADVLVWWHCLRGECPAISLYSQCSVVWQPSPVAILQQGNTPWYLNLDTDTLLPSQHWGVPAAWLGHQFMYLSTPFLCLCRIESICRQHRGKGWDKQLLLSPSQVYIHVLKWVVSRGERAERGHRFSMVSIFE